MKKSYNGWPGIPKSSDARLTTIEPVPGRKMRTRAGDVAVILNHVAYRFHREVESLTAHDRIPDEWGYAYRRVRAGKSLSNHASGTAIDLNATRHPFRTKASSNFSPEQIRAARKIVTDCKGVVRWLEGHDPMHWEIAPINQGGSPVKVAKLAASIRGEEPTGKVRLSVDGMLGPITISALRQELGEKPGTIITRSTIRALQRRLNAKRARDWSNRLLNVDGRGFGTNINRRYPRLGRTRTIWALQNHLDIRPDGALSKNRSATIVAMQQALNSGRGI